MTRKRSTGNKKDLLTKRMLINLFNIYRKKIIVGAVPDEYRIPKYHREQIHC